MKRFRDSKLGRFVSREEAQENPDTTTAETIDPSSEKFVVSNELSPGGTVQIPDQTSIVFERHSGKVYGINDHGAMVYLFTLVSPG